MPPSQDPQAISDGIQTPRKPHRMKFTQAAVDGLAKPATGRFEVWDTLLPGFGMRVSESGLKTWQAFYRVNGKMVREKLGTLAQIPNVADARERARMSMTRAKGGTNPVEQKRQAEEERKRQAEVEEARKRNTLAVILDRYLAERSTVNKRGKPLASEYLAEIRRALTKDVASSKLGATPITEVDGKAVKALVRGIAKKRPGHANHVLTYLTTALHWAVDEDIIEKNPAVGVPAPAPRTERDRVLDDDEIRLFWQACDRISWPFGPLFQLLLLLGPRRDELAHATWREFKFDEDTGTGIWSLPSGRSKNGQAHITHLAPFAVEIMDKLPEIANPQSYVFCHGRGSGGPVIGFGHAAQRVKKKMQELAAEEGRTEIEHFTLHDLRRSCASGIAAIGIAPHIIDKILNHSTGQIAASPRPTTDILT